MTDWLDVNSLTESELRRAINALAAAENRLVNDSETGFATALLRQMRRQKTSYSDRLGWLIEEKYGRDIGTARKRYEEILEPVSSAMEKWEEGKVPDFSLVIEYGALEDLVEKDEREKKRKEFEKEKQERERKEKEALVKPATEIRLEP
ncbi:hypothetical protein HYS54_00955 [Candidatus Micrarchaeota archaeon]|nr:hypothetical protein [Candidatus Micrarchaeota archaeon]